MNFETNVIKSTSPPPFLRCAVEYKCFVKFFLEIPVHCICLVLKHVILIRKWKKPHGSLSVKLFRIAKPGFFLLIFDVVLFIKLFKVTLAICLSTTRTLVFSRARLKTFNPPYIFNFWLVQFFVVEWTIFIFHNTVNFYMIKLLFH